MGSRKSPHVAGASRVSPVVPGAVREIALVAPSIRLRSGLVTPHNITQLQRTVGNQAVQRLLSVAPASVQRIGGLVSIQRSYEPSGRQTNELKRKLSKWEKAYLKSGGQSLDDLAADLADYADSHTQALLFIDKLTYDQWSNESGTKAADLENRLLGLGEDSPKVASKAEKDPLDTVRQKIKGKGWDLKLFGVDDLKQIDTNKGTDGWEKALADTYQRLVEAKQNADLKAKLILEYATDKGVGDQRFNTNILLAVWNLSHLIATSPTANINTTIGGEYSDNDIYAAASTWHNTPNIGLVTDFHVPGGSGNGRIEDKSTRLVNPDKTRGRQCDFISYWKGNKINVHVTSNVPH